MPSRFPHLIQPLRAAFVREHELDKQARRVLGEKRAVVCEQADLLRALQREGIPTTVAAVSVRVEAGLAGKPDFRRIFAYRARQRMLRCAEAAATAGQPAPPPAPPTPPQQVVKRVTTTETREFEPTPVGPPRRRNGWLRSPGSK